MRLGRDDLPRAVVDKEIAQQQPRIRRDCLTGGINESRPCVRVTCRWNLYLDVNPSTGSIKLNFPDLEPGEMTSSCALDIADQGGSTLEEIGAAYNITRERSRQVETNAFDQLTAAGLRLRVFSHDEVPGHGKDPDPRADPPEGGRRRVRRQRPWDA